MGLTAPLRALSFEFTPEYLDAAAQCVARLLSLGNYEFNYSSTSPWCSRSTSG